MQALDRRLLSPDAPPTSSGKLRSRKRKRTTSKPMNLRTQDKTNSPSSVPGTPNEHVYSSPKESRETLMNESEPELLLQPDTRPISLDQLVAEVKGIYAGLVMVETKCMIVGEMAMAVPQELGTRLQPPLTSEQWSALMAFYKALLHEHHDFFLARSQPAASPAPIKARARYSMLSRTWRYDKHLFLELIRSGPPKLPKYMLTFLDGYYSMTTMPQGTPPSFQDTRFRFLGDLARYRMAMDEIEEFQDTWGECSGDLRQYQMATAQILRPDKFVPDAKQGATSTSGTLSEDVVDNRPRSFLFLAYNAFWRKIDVVGSSAWRSVSGAWMCRILLWIQMLPLIHAAPLKENEHGTPQPYGESLAHTIVDLAVGIGFILLSMVPVPMARHFYGVPLGQVSNVLALLWSFWWWVAAGKFFDRKVEIVVMFIAALGFNCFFIERHFKEQDLSFSFKEYGVRMLASTLVLDVAYAKILPTNSGRNQDPSISDPASCIFLALYSSTLMWTGIPWMRALFGPGDATGQGTVSESHRGDAVV